MQNLRGVNIFFASPAGLADERRAFRSVIEKFNRDQAHENSVTFIAEGWEYTVSGVGRPQAIINEQVRKCDYLLVVLHNDWGSTTAVGGRYSSGTEEEFYVGLESLRPPEVGVVLAL